jgi:DNA-binding transcriptional LysR family regulator
MIPSASDLTYFVEVSTSLNLSRAAERLGISQPALTLSIQRLEQSVGTKLLIRSKKGVALTQGGKQLLAHSRELLQRWDAIRGRALASTNEVQGSYVIGCHPSVALYSLPGFLPVLLEEHPRLEIKLHHDLSRKITESVIRLETDIGIAVNPSKHPDLVVRKLCDDTVTFWVGEGKRGIQDFRAGSATLVCDPDLLQSQDLLKKLRKSGIRYGRIVPSSSLEVVTQLVASGAGIGIIPARVAALAGPNRLRRVPGAPVFDDEICLLYRVENKAVRSIQAIGESIVASVGGPAAASRRS